MNIYAQKSFTCKSPSQTDSSVYIVWNSVKKSFSKTEDYQIYVNKKKQPLKASEQAVFSNKNTAEYKKAFYNHYNKKLTGINMVKNEVTFFCVKDLEPDTEVQIYVEAVDKKGKSLCVSEAIFVRTKKLGKTLNVVDFGAVCGEKITNRACSLEDVTLIEKNTRAIQKAIDLCPQDGIVYIPNGIFMCGGLNLKSNMTLKIDGVLCASPFARHYDFGFLMYEYYTDERRWGLLNAVDAENITLTGSGTVDGNGWFFSDSNGKKQDFWSVYIEEGDIDFTFEKKSEARQLVRYLKGNNRTVYDLGILASDCAETFLKERNLTWQTASKNDLAEAYSSRSTTVIFRRTKNILIENLLFLNPANHMINILDSSDITITGITEFTYDANNGDGVGLICSKNSFVFNNFFDTGDDCIVFSAGVGKSATKTGQSGASDSEIFSNYFHHGHGGVAFGSHTALGIERIFVHDNVFNHTDAPFRIKSAPANGGYVKDILFERNAIACARQPFIMSTEYNDAGTVTKYGPAEKPAVFSDIICRNCTVYKVGGTTIYISGRDENPHSNILFKNVVFAKSGNLGQYIKNCENFRVEK